MPQPVLDPNNACGDPAITPPRRADAMNNRARIIAAARAAIADDGISLREIARRAGVGQGTLYRHFPTRQDLLAAVYRDEVRALSAAAPALLAEYEPLEALAHWLDCVAAYARMNRDFVGAVDTTAL